MPFSDHLRLAKAALPAVLEAAEIEMRHFSGGVSVEQKADRTPVTAADREAEAILVAGLARAAPGVPVVAEEMASLGCAPPPGDTFFLVDPLDGTREFIVNGREFTINIGLISAGRPVFGLIYAPALARLYVTLGPDAAAAGSVPPARAHAADALTSLRQIVGRDADPQALDVIESRSRAPSQLDALFTRHRVKLRQRAASSLKFCLVAEGLSDAYVQFGKTCEWDTAAGEAILTAAGGAVYALDGSALTYGACERGFVNPPFIAWGRKSPPPW